MRMTRALLAATAISATMLAGLTAQANETRTPGLITSNAVSTIVSTKNLEEGLEMSALWISMYPGNRVQTAQYVGKWAGLWLSLSGSSVYSGKFPPGKCAHFAGGLSEDLSGREVVSKPGDGSGCSTLSPAWWEENRSTEPYEFAQLGVGVDHPGDPGSWPDYQNAGGLVRGVGLEPREFAPVGDVLRAAGAMTLSIRNVTMPPGARMVVDDTYPALRMITRGKIRWGQLPPEADTAAAPKEMFTASVTTWISWADARRTVIANETDKLAQFIEWSVAPAPGAAP